jgi:hypothetical protein
MATTGNYTIQQLFRHPYVLKVISRIKQSGNPFTSFYRMGLGDAATKTIPAGIRVFAYETFDHTRQLATARAPMTGPAKGRPQKYGNKTGAIIRMHDALPVSWESIVNMRPVGTPIGTLDRSGQNYVTQQISHWSSKYSNTREWVLSRMFRGGFSLTIDGDTHYFGELGAGDIDITFDFPAAHKDQLAIGASDADIIDTSWDSTTADIVSQFLNLNKAAERISGYVIEHVWINSTTLGLLMNNTNLQAKGGSAFRTFDSLEWRDMSTMSEGQRRRGFDVRFRGMPWITFHTYDGVLQAGTAVVDSTADADSFLQIPDGVAIMTPSPGPWLGYAEGQEPVTKTLASGMEILTGFQTWRRPMLDPSGVELCWLDNFFPIPYVPTAWFYATVVFS